MSIRWGHFSDLHFDFKSFETKLLRDSLLKNLKKNKINLNYIFITGDILHKGKYDEETTKFIKEIARLTECKLENIIICPGNHDVKRSPFRKRNIEAIIEQSKKNNNINFPEEDKDALITRTFKPFYDICETVTGNKQHEELHYVLNCDEINLYVLNTAVFAGQTCPEDNPTPDELKKEDTCLYICDDQLYELKKMKSENNCNDNSLNIVIGHHGVECFTESEQKKLRNLLDSLDVDLYLCGHVHKNALDYLSKTDYMIPQISCGGLFSDGYNEPSFIIGEFDSNNKKVKLTNYSYIQNNDKWSISYGAPKPYNNGIFPYEVKRIKQLEATEEDKSQESTGLKQQEYALKLHRYTLLSPRGADGIKYYWEKNGRFVESLAFNSRLKIDERNLENEKVSAYTTSVSFGCILSSDSTQCKFCETGTIGFEGYLTAEEIALQNIFMAEYDSDCPSYPRVRGNSREFAYMGQGEPGHAYHLVRESILLTDCAMRIINQEVERYIISSCGIKGFIPLLINDLKNKVFENKVTVHFSLNAIDSDRNILMPINKDYDYNQFIKECKELYKYTKEKIGVGILILDQFVTSPETNSSYTLTEENLKNILKKLDPDTFKIDLCDYNSTTIDKQSQVSNEYANKLLKVVTDAGFDGKLFSSFGTDKGSGCGMLKSSLEGSKQPGNKTVKHYNSAIELLNKAKKELGY
ncbi:metallophosphoesterase [Clostridium sp. VAP41]|uniref:metallophosphoesterase n=1 Tax=Clostridium sp. VAP41 TaxID=2949979 RepID=UPI00207AF399|nr:metallophosphoesterase [Clostridium sp. VAP41]